MILKTKQKPYQKSGSDTEDKILVFPGIQYTEEDVKNLKIGDEMEVHFEDEQGNVTVYKGHHCQFGDISMAAKDETETRQSSVTLRDVGTMTSAPEQA